MECLKDLGEKMVFLNSLHKYKWDVICILIPTLILGIAFSDIIMDPNGFIFHPYGDAVKNYFTPTWYVNYDTGWTFSGMNYPYGEVLPFTDNQPLLSIKLQKLNSILPFIGSNVVGIMNLLMFLSFILCSYFSFKIFQHFGINGFWAIWAGLIVAFLSPQIDRMDVHFALGYSWFIPLVWLIILKAKSFSGQPLIWLFLLLILFFQSFVHPYFLIINALLIGGIVAVDYLSNYKSTARPNSFHLWALGTLSLSILIFLAINHTLDPISDRPSNPYGLDAYTSSLGSLLFPARGPIYEILEPQYIVGEGEAYVGILGMLFVLLGAINVALRFRDKTLPRLVNTNRPMFFHSLIAGVLVFFYSSGWLNDLGLKYLNEFIPQLKQFRSLGRFAWITYYIGLTSMLTLTILSFKALSKNIRWREYALLPILAMIIWSVEAYIHSNILTKDLRHPNTFSQIDDVAYYPDVLSQNEIEPTDFQAILSLPLVVLGPEKVQIDRGAWPLRVAMPASLQLHLPLMNIMMSRTSVSQGLDLLEMLAPQYVTKQRLRSMDERPVLIISNDNDVTPNEKDLINRSQLLFQHGGLHYYKADPVDFYDPIAPNAILSDTSDLSPMIHFDFNDRNGPAYAGESGLDLEGYDLELWKGSVSTNKIYEASFWIKIDADLKRLPTVTFKKMGPEGKLLWSGNFNFKGDIISHRGWLRVNWLFDGMPNADVFSILIRGKEVIIDEFQIRMSDHPSVVKTNHEVMVNNYNLTE